MEQWKTCRLNAMNITSVRGFAQVRGGINRGCKDVYFVRAIGRNGNLEQDVLEMDRQLQKAAAEKKGFYKRIQTLPGQLSYEDSLYYAECYDRWMQEGRRRVQTRGIQKGAPEMAELLARACETVEKLYLEETPRASESMQKNLIVKLLFWYDAIFEEHMFDVLEGSVRKLAASNVVKKQEYLFYYLAALTGCDVLLLQSKADIDCSGKWKSLSASFTLGGFSEEELLPCGEWNGITNLGGDDGRNTGSGERTGFAVNPASGLERRLPQGQFSDTVVPDQSGPQPKGNPANPDARTSSGMIRVVIPEHRRSGRGSSAARGGSSSAQEGRGSSAVRSGASAVSGGRSISAQNGRPLSAPGGQPVSQVPPGQVEKSYEELAQLASSVVMIALHDRAGEVIGTGSGIMIGKEGYILTNNHVARGGCYYSVKIEEDDQIYTTDEMIKYNSVLDLAVIRISRKLWPLPIYRGQKKLVRGQRVVAIGSPLGLFNSVSDGIISGFRKVDNVDMIQFTAPTSHGSSGGAVLNLYGEVIGISTAGFDAGQNLNLAVGYEYIHTFVQGFT